MRSDLLSDDLGCGGTALLLSTHALVSNGGLEGGSIPYQLLKLLGSTSWIVNAVHYGVYPSVELSTVSIGIAIVAILSGRLGRR